MSVAFTSPRLDRRPRSAGNPPDPNPFVMRRWVAPLAWALLILSLTSIPGSTLEPVPIFPHADKLAHLALYGMLGTLVGRSVPSEAWRPRATVMTLMVLAVFAFADEWHQELIPGRSADPADWVADVIGASSGLALGRLSLRNREQTS